MVETILAQVTRPAGEPGYAAVIEVDSGELTSVEARSALGDALAPTMRQIPGLRSGHLTYESGRATAVVLFESRHDAERLCGGVQVGLPILRADVLEISGGG